MSDSMALSLYVASQFDVQIKLNPRLVTQYIVRYLKGVVVINCPSFTFLLWQWVTG